MTNNVQNTSRSSQLRSMTNSVQLASKADAIAMLLQRKADLKLCTVNDTVLMWENGLCVALDASGKAYATAPDKARRFNAVEARRLNVKNGNGEAPKLVLRHFAVKHDLAIIEELLVIFG